MKTARGPGPPQFPTPGESTPRSTQAEMDAAVDSLRSRKDRWVALPVRQRIAIIDEVIRDVAAAAARWVSASLRVKGFPADSPATTEEWAGGPYALLRNLRLLRRALADIDAHGRPRIPGPVNTRADGQVAARVFPQTMYDRMLFRGITLDVWMQPGLTPSELADTQAVAYRDQRRSGKVALILGAGNHLSLSAMDALHKLFVEVQAVALKLSPVNALLGPLLEETFRALIERGLLCVVYGGAEEGTYLCHHVGTDEIHVTGSDKTFDAIVSGSGPRGVAGKSEQSPPTAKRVTAELGNVSPIIVVPGRWSDSDLRYHAEHVVTSVTANAGCNCNATQVLIQHSGWPQRDQFLEHIRRLLADTPPRRAFYPGTEERRQAFLEAHPEAEEIGAPAPGQLPWTLVPDVEPKDDGDVCFTAEAFCGLLAETAIEATSVPEYLDRAVELANEQLWGTLCATLIVHKESLKDPAVASAVERAVANLRYGTVAVNYWAAVSYVAAVTPWGAFPGQNTESIQSGTGFVHNTLMLSRPQKAVLRAPFRIRPTPPWFVTRGRAGRQVFQKLVEFEASPSPWKVPSIIWAGLRA